VGWADAGLSAPDVTAPDNVFDLVAPAARSNDGAGALSANLPKGSSVATIPVGVIAHTAILTDTWRVCRTARCDQSEAEKIAPRIFHPTLQRKVSES
jgi:hypothetical protein